MYPLEHESNTIVSTLYLASNKQKKHPLRKGFKEGPFGTES